MRTTDLMVGDWVNVNGLNLKVGAINADKIGVFDPDYKIYWCSDDGLDSIDPIPLTEEILVKNSDFTVRGEYVISGQTRNPYLKIAWSRDKGKFYFSTLGSNCYLDYVHQLQHLLRLCGIEKEISI